MDDIAWTDKRDHKYWYTVACPCGAEGEIGLPIDYRGTIGCPDEESGCAATLIQWAAPEGIRLKWVVTPCYENDTSEIEALKTAIYHCNICGGDVSFPKDMKAPSCRIGPGNPGKHSQSDTAAEPKRG